MNLEQIKLNTRGMLVDGSACSEMWDTSGERIHLDGMDISSVLDGSSTFNWEHGEKPNDTVGRVIYGRKIYGPNDCEDDRQRYFWEKSKVPYLYIVGELFDAPENGHKEAQAIAGIIRYYQNNGLPILARYSVEGSTLERKGPELLQTIARRFAITIKPANKGTILGVLNDPNAPQVVKDSANQVNQALEQDPLQSIFATKKSEDPQYSTLGYSIFEFIPFEPNKRDVRKLVKSITKLKALNSLKKALEAGNYNVAPSNLTQGAALQRESLGLSEEEKKKWHGTIKAILRDWDRNSEPLKVYATKIAKHYLPDASPKFLNHFGDLVEQFQVRIKKNQDDYKDLVKIDPGKFTRKLEFTVLELKKAVDDVKQPIEQPKVHFGGKEIEPGEMTYHDGNKYAVLHQDDEHVIYASKNALPNWKPENLKRISRAHEGNWFTLHKPAEPKQKEGVVDSNVHAIPEYTKFPEQHKMVHGMDFNTQPLNSPGHYLKGANNDFSHWRLGGHGKNVFVKLGDLSEIEPGQKELTSPKAAVAYHNIAKNFFGLGDYVPNTALIKHPANNSIMSVMESVPNAEHIQSNIYSAPTAPHQMEILKNLGDSGELEKLAVMDNVLLNTDRHIQNFLFSPNSPKLHLIDHDYTLISASPPSVITRIPAYLRMYVAMNNPNHKEDHRAWEKNFRNKMLEGKSTEALNDPKSEDIYLDKLPLHPNTANWIMSLDPSKLDEQLKEHGVHDEARQASIFRLQRAQQAIKSSNGNISKAGLLNSMFKSNQPLTALPPHVS